MRFFRGHRWPENRALPAWALIKRKSSSLPIAVGRYFLLTQNRVPDVWPELFHLVEGCVKREWLDPPLAGFGQNWRQQTV
jgi:hypothetical protein